MSNNVLIPNPDKEDTIASTPKDWPLMRMCGWGDQQSKYYLIVTPMIWWGATASLLIGVLAFGVYVFRMQRRYVDMEPSAWTSPPFSSVRVVSDPVIMHAGEWEHFLYVGKISLFSWALYYCEYFARPYRMR